MDECHGAIVQLTPVRSGESRFVPREMDEVVTPRQGRRGSEVEEYFIPRIYGLAGMSDDPNTLTVRLYSGKNEGILALQVGGGGGSNVRLR